MEKPFFIMMHHPALKAMPIMKGEDHDERVAFYATKKDARKVADDHSACQAYGYEIFEMGTGE